MNKKSLINASLISAFCVFLFLGSISLVSMNYMPFVEAVPTFDPDLIRDATLQFAYSFIIAVPSMLLAAKYLLDLLKGRKINPNFIGDLVAFVGLAITIIRLIDMTMTSGWNTGFKWEELFTGIVIIFLTGVSFAVKKIYKLYLGTITTIWALSYFAFAFVSYATSETRVAMYVYLNFTLAFILASAFFLSRIFLQPTVQK
jgi:hypothetical protein